MTESSPAVEIRQPIEYEGPPGPRTGLLVTLALAWLTVVLWFAHAVIAANGYRLALISAAIALPTVVAASLLAGGSVGLAAVSVLARRGVAAAERTPVRLGVAALAGLLSGGLAGASVMVTWGGQSSAPALAVVVGLAGVVGAALAITVPPAVAAAGLVATFAVFVTGFAINFLFREWLMGAFGAGESAASQYRAFWWFTRTAAAVSALVGGLVAFWSLRRAGMRRMRWPAYLAAGAAPGLMLMLAEAVTRLGGSRLLTLAGANEPDGLAFAWDGDSRFRYALIVIFLGSIVAMIAFGRTLPTRQAAEDETAEDETAEDQAAEDRAAEDETSQAS